MKRKIAGLLSLTMILSSMSINAFAESLPAAVDDTTGGDATVNAIDTVIYRVIVPTDVTLDYIADPQGLAQLEDSQSQVIGNLTGGKVYSGGEVSIANRSSKDVTVEAKVTVENGAASTTTNAQIVEDFTASDPTNPEFKLALVPSTETTFTVGTSSDSTYNVAGGSADSDKYKVTTDTKETTDKTGYWLTEGSGDDADKFTVTVPVHLKKAEYVAKSTPNGSKKFEYSIKDDSVGGAVSFSLAGECSTDDTWSKGTTANPIVAPKVKVKYSFKNATVASWGDDTAKVDETGLGSAKVTTLKTAPIKVTSANEVKASAGKVDIKLLADNTAFATAYAADSTILPAANVVVKKGSTAVAGSFTVDAETGVIKFVATTATDIGADDVLTVYVDYNGKRYIKNDVTVEATEIEDATATTDGVITVPAPTGVSAIGNVTGIDVKVDGTSLDAADYTASLDDDNIVIEVTDGLTEDDPVVVTFKVGSVPYKATATVTEAPTDMTACTVASGVIYANLDGSVLDETKVAAATVTVGGTSVASSALGLNGAKTKITISSTSATSGTVVIIVYDGVTYKGTIA